jgi:hypothetical protein
MLEPQIINFKQLGDIRGQLVAIEGEASIPFPIRRIYYIYGTPQGVERGFHAHKVLRQVAVAVAGSCELLLDDGESKFRMTLNSPEQGVVVESRVWHEMRHFSSDCVLLVLAEFPYDETDYLRDYNQFLEYNSK